MNTDYNLGAKFLRSGVKHGPPGEHTYTYTNTNNHGSYLNLSHIDPQIPSPSSARTFTWTKSQGVSHGQ